jgi:hypothetical protein
VKHDLEGVLKCIGIKFAHIHSLQTVTDILEAYHRPSQTP